MGRLILQVNFIQCRSSKRKGMWQGFPIHESSGLLKIATILVPGVVLTLQEFC